MRSALRYLLSSLLVGVLSVGLAWAGSGLVPVSNDVELPKVKAQKADLSVEGDGESTTNEDGIQVPPAGQVLAGAAKISMEPQPAEGDIWERDMGKCSTLSASFFENLPENLDHVASAGSPWPENPNCIYMGGFGIGPMNPIREFDQYDPAEDGVNGGADGDPNTGYGLWVRSFAVRGPNGKTLTLTIIDAEGYLWDYASKCTDCGIKQMAAELASDPSLGLEKEGIIIGATHSHAAPEFLGGWGFVPDWYMTQISTAIKDSVRQAIANMEPAVLEAGQAIARPFNNERRDTYRSAEEQELTWLRAIATEGLSGEPNQGDPDVIATIGAFAGHPTNWGTNDGIASADWPAKFEKKVEDQFGGVGLYFMTGLGNMSSAGRDSGLGLASLIPNVGGGLRLQNTDVKYAQTTWIQPATNVPLSALGVPGFFDRKFVPEPSSVSTGKSPDTAPCASASAASVELPATAARIGNLFAVSAAPGEIFANVSNTIKEKSGAPITMPLGQVNDALGYMPQSFELHPVGQQGLGFVAGGAVFVNYEDSYSIDRCVGDMVLETIIGLFGSI
jgi:hypothetical protein